MNDYEAEAEGAYRDMAADEIHELLNDIKEFLRTEINQHSCTCSGCVNEMEKAKELIERIG